MRRLLSIASLLVLAASVNAQEAVTLTWTNATLNTDGTPFTDLDYTNIYYGVCDPTTNDVPTSPNVEPVPGPAETWTTPELAVGDWCFRATHVNLQAEESAQSNLATRTVVDTIVPQPPLNLTVSATNQAAYAISQTNDRLVLVPVGTVPAGTPCDGTMSANGRFLVPRDDVVWAGTARPAVVLAECS